MTVPLVTPDTLVIRKHAAQEMKADNISVADAITCINDGEVIKPYPADRPYPSRLILCIVAERPLHVVAATDEATGLTYLITTYVADPNLWEVDFKTRRKP